MFFCYAECPCAEFDYAECRRAECDYAECRYAECHGAPLLPPSWSSTLAVFQSANYVDFLLQFTSKLGPTL